MDSLKSLLDAKKYELVIKLTDTSREANDLFYRISAFIFLGKYEDALYVIQDNQLTLQKSNLAALINVHIELLCTLQRYEQAYSILDYYSNLPYESQVVEEILRKMPSIIENEEKRKNAVGSMSEEEIIEKLHSDNAEEVLFALDVIKKLDVLTFLSEIAYVLVKNPKQTVRSFALMLLVKKELDRDLDFLSYNGLIKVNPKKLSAPFTGLIFNSILKRMDLEYKNSTISQNGAQILSTYVIYTYPHEINKDEDEILGAVYLYSLYLLQDNSVTLDDYVTIHNVDKEKLKAYYELIDSANNDF